MNGDQLRSIFGDQVASELGLVAQESSDGRALI